MIDRRAAGLVLVAGLLTSGRSVPFAVAAPKAPRLTAGQAAFWTAEEYALDVRGGGDRLRIAVDHATVGDVFHVTVSMPGGDSRGFTPGDGLYSAEVVFDDPSPGLWEVRVSTSGAKDRRFRMRALLEVVPPAPARKVAVPPNLQPLPPYEFNFLTPLTNGSTGGAPEGLPAPGGRASCHPEEAIEEGAVRCLRMAFGVRNTGRGPMQLSYTGTELDVPLRQRVSYSDGTHVDRSAGRAVYHKTHQHYHHADAVALRLYRVTDPARGTLETAGSEHRKGFAHRSEMLREWRTFYPTWPHYGFGLDAGWGDYYEWDRPGNYVDFGINGDGRYVVRIVADPTNGILESNDKDNTGYSYVEVTGDTVKLLESGRGSSPWDRCRIVVPFGAEPALPKGVTQPRRPANCPPDTV